MLKIGAIGAVLLREKAAQQPALDIRRITQGLFRKL